MSAPKPLATEEQVCEWLQMDPEKFKTLRKRGNAPRAIKVSRTERRYAWGDVHAWARQRMEEHAGE